MSISEHPSGIRDRSKVAGIYTIDPMKCCSQMAMCVQLAASCMNISLD